MTKQTSTRQRSWGPIFVAGLTVVASIGVAAVVSRQLAPTDKATLADSGSIDTLAELITRITRLERRIDAMDDPELDSRLLTEHRAGSNEAPAVDAVSGEPVSADIDERVARLETIEQERQESRRLRVEQQQVIEQARRVERAQLAAEAATIMMDPVADERAKAQAWQNMRMNAPDAWTDPVVAEAVRIGTTSQNSQLRADIWRQAHANHTHPMLLQPLLQALASDSDNFVREEAAETLDLYLDQPGVREALQIAAEYDAHPSVRRQATISLAGPTGGF